MSRAGRRTSTNNIQYSIHPHDVSSNFDFHMKAAQLFVSFFILTFSLIKQLNSFLLVVMAPCRGATYLS